MSKIEWTNETWNPIIGCSKVSSGCKNCYAISMISRFQNHPNQKVRNKFAGTVENMNWTGNVNFDEGALLKPLKWEKPRMIFVNSMSDLFHENVPDEWIDKIFAIMALCPQHTFQVLTKRPERMKQYFERLDNQRLNFYYEENECMQGFLDCKKGVGVKHIPVEWDTKDCENTLCSNQQTWNYLEYLGSWVGFKANEFRKDERTNSVLLLPKLPLPNVWLGVSVENQQTFDARINDLILTPASIRFISAEPLLGDIHMVSEDTDYLRGQWYGNEDGLVGKIDWVIVGGESGPNARPMTPDWVRVIRDQCQKADVPFFFKQWGSYNQHGQKVGKKQAGDLLDNKKWEQFPIKILNA